MLQDFIQTTGAATQRWLLQRASEREGDQDLLEGVQTKGTKTYPQKENRKENAKIQKLQRYRLNPSSAVKQSKHQEAE